MFKKKKWKKGERGDSGKAETKNERHKGVRHSGGKETEKERFRNRHINKENEAT